MYRSIVVGTDGSPPAQRAVAAAAELAKLCGARLHLVTAYRLPAQMTVAGATAERGVLPRPGAEEDVRTEVESMLATLAKEIEAEGIDVTTHARLDAPVRAILDVAGREGAELIVVGNRGLLGGVPINVTHRAACSVLVVHTV
jgi:nucleotide-binding universal stress UspA family protein